MIVAIASGKGGTGKTTVAVSLALSLADSATASPPLLVDCDVEEPNAGLFLDPTFVESREVGQLVPEVDFGLCTFCGRCAEVCQYNAIAVAGEKVLVFPELCHGCGSCSLCCPAGAIREVMNPLGTIERGWAGASPVPGSSASVEFAQGKLNVGEALAVPVIRQLKDWAIPRELGDRAVLIDAPPGTACPVVESMSGADFVLLVTEPTPFGLHDLRLAVEVARDQMGLPVGVVVNRDGGDYQAVDEYLKAQAVPILMRIPLDRTIAEASSDGTALVQSHPAFRERFEALYAALPVGDPAVRP